MKLSTDQQRDRWLAFVQGQSLPLDVQCEPWKEPRTNPQNAYLWKAVYEPLVERCGFIAEEWHEYFCGEHFGWVEHIKPSGEVELKPLRTTTKNEHGKRDVLKGKSFMDFVEFAESECAKKGVFVTDTYQEAAA